MATQATPAQESFEAFFLDKLYALERRAREAGTSITEVCENVGASPHTPRRWKSKTPYTIALMDKLEAEVIKHERNKADGN